MKKLIYILFISLPLMQSCTVSKLTKADVYPKMYDERPLSIAVMPPINTTTNVEAKEFFYITMSRTLCEMGYYVIPPFLCLDLYKTESAYDAENYATGPLDKFRMVLGADAALFTYITEWKKSAVGGKVTVTIEYILRSTITNETIFQRKGTITYDTSVQASGGGAVGLLAGMAATALRTALTDYITVARACNSAVLSDMPAGKYSSSYEVDKTQNAGAAVVVRTVSQ
ncbi:MAG: DUF799 domain-containing protein [Prevotellaceae bacterium]|jgi:hypothetical protein|nr:DUF799 domain-containing protein [Prevotellaceae bacterium]